MDYPAMPGTYSCGKTAETGSKVVFFEKPTPGDLNTSVWYLGICPDPIISPGSGIYQGCVNVSADLGMAGAECYYSLTGHEPSKPTSVWEDQIWIDDVLPPGAGVFAEGSDDWVWVRKPDPVSGTRVHRSLRSEVLHLHGFDGATYPLRTSTGDRLFVYVHLDPAAPPYEVLVQWKSEDGWKRAFWGTDKLGWGPTNSPENYYVGPLPEAGKWIRLEVPAAVLGLEGSEITGMAFCLYGGAAWWDASGRSSTNIANSKVYTGPLTLTNTAVVRFRSIAPGYLPSRVVTRTYLLGFETRFPVVSVACAPEDLMGERDGIIVTGPDASSIDPYYGANFWKRVERPVNAEFIDPLSTNTFNCVLGLQVHGGYSRCAPQKSFELHARKRYGTGKIRCPLFPNRAFDEFEALLLRNAGNDWNRAMMRDRTLQGLVAGLGLGEQAGRPVHVFLNGEYYGILNLRELGNKDHVATHFGVAPDNIDMIFAEATVMAGDILDYNNLISFIRSHDLRNPADYGFVANWIDVDNYIDYQISQIFFDNRDWPGNNTTCWRSRSGDCRWRWLIEDLDAAFDERDAGPARNTLAAAAAVQEAGIGEQSALIFRSLLANPDFRSRFISRFTELLNTRFRSDNVVSLIDALEGELVSEIGRHIERWKDAGYPMWPAIRSVVEWKENVEQMRVFARARPEHVRRHLDSFFDLGGTGTLTLDIVPKSGGLVFIDRLDISGDKVPWRGVFFCKQPVTLRAVAQPGHRFAGWIGIDGTNEITSAFVEGDRFVAARFEKDEEYDLSRLRPKPHDLRWSNYILTGFSPDTPAGSYPPSMIFYQTSQKDPGLEVPMENEWTLPYNRDSRSRIRGLGEMGFSFVNTSDPQPEAGAGFVGAAVLAVRTTGLTNIQ
ncbi:MAG: CotH kinase family protein, partial [Verrucomicrobiae bacterium]|nr:CotH kinase family protein [Verrucomicrobiae bacterium]